METNEISMGTQQLPLKIRLPYQILSVVFGIIALLTFLSVISATSRQFFASALMYLSYVGLNGILAYGLWKMRKWIVPLLGGTILFMASFNIFNIIMGTQRISQTLSAFIIFGALFLFAYFSRKFLNGGYKNLNALGFSAILLVLSQIIIFFLT